VLVSGRAFCALLLHARVWAFLFLSPSPPLPLSPSLTVFFSQIIRIIRVIRILRLLKLPKLFKRGRRRKAHENAAIDQRSKLGDRYMFSKKKGTHKVQRKKHAFSR
jgi:hypothetical protein